MTKCLSLLLAWFSVVGLSAVGLSAGCIPITGSRILGRDLALADSRFSKLPATLTIGSAPSPGTQKIYTAPELERLARANGIQVGDLADICFELPMLPFTEENVTAAMRRSLPAEAVLKIIELAHFDVPAGLLEFPLGDLDPPAFATRGVQLWRGRVTYAETRSFSVWARVEVTVQYTAVVAGKDLPQDAPIGAGSLRMETRTGPPEREKFATRIEDVQGRIPRRALRAGSIVPLAILAEAPLVRRGDPVAVEVRSGLASLRFEAIAEGSAREGDTVELRNPFNGKTFKARLDPGAKALVIITAGQRL